MPRKQPRVHLQVGARNGTPIVACKTDGIWKVTDKPEKITCSRCAKVNTTMSSFKSVVEQVATTCE